MIDKKKEVRLQLDYMQGPIWLTDVVTQEPRSGVEIVDNDDIVCKLNAEIWNMYYDFYYENESTGSIDFDENKYKKNKEMFELLIAKLISRLNAINDGSYYITDYISDLL